MALVLATKNAALSLVQLSLAMRLQRQNAGPLSRGKGSSWLQTNLDDKIDLGDCHVAESQATRIVGEWWSKVERGVSKGKDGDLMP
jgi:hypothetical protein